MSLAPSIGLPPGQNKASSQFIAATPGVWKSIGGAIWKFLEAFGRRRAENVMNHAMKHGYHY